MQPYQMAYNQYLAHVQQSQYPMEQQQIPTQMNTHPLIQNSPLQLLPPQNTTRPTQLPVELVANPKNKTIQAAYNVDLQTYPTYPTYLISTIPLQVVQLRSGGNLSQNKSPITIEEEPKLNSNEKMVDEARNENNAATLKEQTKKG